MKVGLHQGSVLSPLLFVIVMEMIFRELRAGLPLELLYADDLILMADVTAPYLLVGPQLTPTCSCSLFFVGIGSMTK